MTTLDPPSLTSYLAGAIVMLVGVVAPLAYAFTRNSKALTKNKS